MKLNINNSITTNQLHIAESMGDYFSSIADNIGSAKDAMDYTVRDHESIQAIENYIRWRGPILQFQGNTNI